MGTRGYVKEGLELTLMSSFDVEQGGVNSGPGSCRVPEWVRTDGPCEGDAADEATIIDYSRQELIRDNVQLVQQISSVYNTLR